jgi:hypothetical protein
MPQLRLGPKLTIPDLPENMGQVVTRTSNLEVAYVERAVGFAWDTCLHAAIQVNRSLYT